MTLFPQVVVTAWDSTFPLTVSAQLSDASSSGEAFLAGGKVTLTAEHKQERILLSVPSFSAEEGAHITLKVVGTLASAGPVTFSEERTISFTPRFLSILISTSRVVYNAEQPVRIRVLMTGTDGLPYKGTADLFVLDADGYVVRKWNSNHLNVRNSRLIVLV